MGDILLEAFVDLSLTLSSFFEEGFRGSKLNPEIKFLEVSDELGNPKQVTFRKKERLFWDPQASDFFRSLASVAIGLKKGQSLKAAFMAVTWENVLSGLASVKKSSAEPINNPQKNKRTETTRKSESRFQYFRRQRKSKQQ